MDIKEDVSENQEELPPIGGTWKNLYLLVIAVLVVQIILYYFISNIFS